MLNNKAKRIIENIYDVILETSFKKQARKELQKDLEGKNIVVEKEEGKITIQDTAGIRNLYTITIKREIK